MLNIFDSNKLKIRQRLTRLLLSTNLATLLVVGVIAVVGMMNNIDLAADVGIKIGHQSSESSSEALRNQKQLALLENARDIAGDVRYKLTIIGDDVRIVANMMHDIDIHPEKYIPRSIPRASQFVEGDHSYMMVLPSARPDEHEIGMAANLDDLLWHFSKSYYLGNMRSSLPQNPTFGVAFESGFLIVADGDVSAEQINAEGDEFNFVERPWYRAAVEHNRLVFTEPYGDSFLTGHGGISCSMPYERDGEFAGVVYCGIFADVLKSIIENNADADFSFVLNRNGRVMLSTEIDDENLRAELGIALENAPDIRESTHPTLAATAKKMVADEEGVDAIDIDGKNYYIAYSPIKELDWSFATAIAEEKVLAPVVQNKAIIERLTLPTPKGGGFLSN